MDIKYFIISYAFEDVFFFWKKDKVNNRHILAFSTGIWTDPIFSVNRLLSEPSLSVEIKFYLL